MLFIAGCASLAAGVIHAAAVAGHSDNRSAVWVFLATAGVQIAWGVAALARPRRWVAIAGVVTGAAALCGWLVVKNKGVDFVGLPRETPQFVDTLCAILAGVVLIASEGALLVKRRIPVIPVALLSVIALVALVPGSASAVNHRHSSATATHVDAPPAVVPTHPFDPNLPIDLSGVPGVTPQEQARAENLLAVTLYKLPQWSDPAYDVAHGFVSIGDGVTGVEHYVNPTFMNDNIILDPDHPESLVFDTTVTPKKLVAAMYMALPNTPLDQVPDIGGALTQWHIHDNLCFTASGKVGGLTKADGSCSAPLVKGPLTPMIHVWIEPHRCGPFAALEGIGGGQILPGETVACDNTHGTT
jgi:hypothetical protein